VRSLRFVFLILFILFLWLDVTSTIIFLKLRNNMLDLVDSKLFLACSNIAAQLEKGVDYIILSEISQRFGLNGVVLMSQDERIILGTGKLVLDYPTLPDSFLYWDYRKMIYKCSSGQFIIASIGEDYLRDISRSWKQTIILKILIYVSFVILGLIFLYGAIPVKREKETVQKKDEYLIKSLEDIIKKLRKENAELKEYAERIKSSEELIEMGRNISTILHEIRNSAGTIIGYSKLIQDREIGERIYREALLLNRVSDSLLLLAKPITLSKTRINLRELFLDIQLPETVDLNLRCKKSITVNGDYDLLRRAFENIILNAVNAMGERGSIFISVREEEEWVRISIRDTGKGMDEEILKNMFKMFHTGEGRGIGIGLWLTKKIIDAHGGRIEIKSKKGKGTTVIVRLPL